MSSTCMHASLTCNSPSSLPPPHVTLSPTRSKPMTGPNSIWTSPVSQCFSDDTGLMVDKLAALFLVGSMMIQLKVKFSSKSLRHESSSQSKILTPVGTTSFGSNRSSRKGERLNHPDPVSVTKTREKISLLLYHKSTAEISSEGRDGRLRFLG
uniref:Uncharacterized protein n=1 Tax=Opuntia streptacantha TaxID=393608 RepID=A0A7C9CFI5_OPUST